MKTKKRWVPKDGEAFWYIETYETPEAFRSSYHVTVDKKMFLAGNCFKTKADAQRVLRKIKKVLREG